MTHKFSNLQNFIIKSILVLLILFGLLDCSSGGSNSQNSKTISSITVTPANISIPIGVVTQFQATAIYNDNSKQDVTNLITWSSNSTSVATVSNSTNSMGLVTPISIGTTLIRASLGSVSGSANLTVNTATLQSAAISSDSLIMVAGTKQQLTATGIFSDGSKQNMTLSGKWGVNDNNLASISNTPGSAGVLSAINNGTIIVNISLPTNITNIFNPHVSKFKNLQYNKNTLDPLATLSIISSNSPIKSIQVSPSNYKMYVGTQQQYNAEAILEDGTQYDVTSSVIWSEPNNFINSQGYLTAKFATNTSITATLGTLSGSTNLTVVSSELQSIVISPINPTVGIAIPIQFIATGIFSDGGSQNITTEATWFSSDTKIATINNPFASSGEATPLTAGSTNITAFLNGVSSSATTLNVVPKTLDSIQISPTNPSTHLSVMQQFTAIRIYSDGSTQDITNEATWVSSATNIAIIGNADNNSGLATPLTTGSTNITAALNGVTSAISTLTISNATILSIQISPTNPKVYLGSEQQFAAIGIYSDGSTQDITNEATWATSQSNIATISNFSGSEGLATPVALGSTNITATFNGKVSLASTLTVSNATLQSIQISPINPSTSINTPIQMKAIGIYSDGGNQEITTQVEWVSSQTAIAIISNASETNGLVTPITAGTTNITASLNGVTSSASVLTVNSITLTSIAITPITATAELGTFEQYTAIGTYSDASTQNITNDVTWRSSQISIATISNSTGSKGLATPITAGTTSMTATLNGVTSNTATLTVSSATLTSIAITPTNAVAELGTFEQYTAIGTYSDGKTENITNDVTWRSSQISIATISNSSGSKGLATPVAAGTTSITATLNGVTSNTATLRVDAATLTSIAITPGNSSIDSNDTRQFTAIGTYSDGDTEDITNNVTHLTHI